jgi:hypothetical protein
MALLQGDSTRSSTHSAHGEQVYHTTAHLPKDNEEVNTYIKCLQAMLDVAIVIDPVLDRDNGTRGHELDHW